MSRNATEDFVTELSVEDGYHASFARSLDHHVLIADARKERSKAIREAAIWLAGRVVRLARHDAAEPRVKAASLAPATGPAPATCA